MEVDAIKVSVEAPTDVSFLMLFVRNVEVLVRFHSDQTVEKKSSVAAVSNKATVTIESRTVLQALETLQDTREEFLVLQTMLKNSFLVLFVTNVVQTARFLSSLEMVTQFFAVTVLQVKIADPIAYLKLRV